MSKTVENHPAPDCNQVQLDKPADCDKPNEVIDGVVTALPLWNRIYSNNLAVTPVLAQIVYWYLPRENGGAKVTRRLKENPHIWLTKTVNELAFETGLKPKQVRRALDILEADGIIQTSVHGAGGLKTTFIRLTCANGAGSIPNRQAVTFPKCPAGQMPVVIARKAKPIKSQSAPQGILKSPTGQIESAPQGISNTQTTSPKTTAETLESVGASQPTKPATKPPAGKAETPTPTPCALPLQTPQGSEEISGSVVKLAKQWEAVTGQTLDEPKAKTFGYTAARLFKAGCTDYTDLVCAIAEPLIAWPAFGSMVKDKLPEAKRKTYPVPPEPCALFFFEHWETALEWWTERKAKAAAKKVKHLPIEKAKVTESYLDALVAKWEPKGYIGIPKPDYELLIAAGRVEAPANANADPQAAWWALANGVGAAEAPTA